jgi:trk system potassium uptake protein TrkH
MLLSGVNYSAYFLLLSRKWKEAFRMDEVRWYLAIILGSVALITFNTKEIMGGGLRALHHAFFQVASIITTTGYSTLDYEIWPHLSKTVLLCLMFIGACAGSTGGGIKVSRFLLLMKSFKKEIGILIHPRAVKVIRMDRNSVKHEVIRSTNVFISIYVVIFFLSLLLISLDDHDFTTNFTAVAATLNNIGPGFSMVGPSCNFGFFSVPSKIVLIFDMLAGRLELFPILLMLTPETWKKN